MVAHFDVISVGEAKVDMFMTLHDAVHNASLKDLDICFRYGAKIEVERYDMQMGGNAANVTVGLSRLGLKTSLFAQIGDDELSLLVHNSLAKENINRSHIIHSTHAASSVSVIINFKGDRTIFSQHVTRDHNFHFEDMTAEYLFLTSLGEDWKTPYRRALDFAVANNIKIAFNPGGYQFRSGKDFVHEIIKHTDILFLNKEESEKIIYGDDLRDTDNSPEYIKILAEGLVERGTKMAVITNGKHGSYVLDTEGNFHHEGLYPGEAVERTGAGDAYTAGFLSAVIHKLPIKTAMHWGSINSSSVVGMIGAQAGLLTKSVMEKRAE
ncbi:MAG TPA: carbohydrate kinase family protein [Patescibacteria group bacterium]